VEVEPAIFLASSDVPTVFRSTPFGFVRLFPFLFMSLFLRGLFFWICFMSFFFGAPLFFFSPRFLFFFQRTFDFSGFPRFFFSWGYCFQSFFHFRFVGRSLFRLFSTSVLLLVFRPEFDCLPPVVLSSFRP